MFQTTNQTKDSQLLRLGLGSCVVLVPRLFEEVQHALRHHEAAEDVHLDHRMAGLAFFLLEGFEAAKVEKKYGKMVVFICFEVLKHGDSH